MNFSISVTIGLDDYEAKARKYADENQCDDLIDMIQEELEQLDGVEQVMFNHSSWMTIDLGVDNFDVAKREVEVVKEEIRQVFAKYGVE